MTRNGVKITFSRQWEKSENSKWIIPLNVFLLVKEIQRFCGQLWLFKIFMKIRCYQNKMYNTLSGSVVVDVESEYVQMLSICLATPLTPVT